MHFQFSTEAFSKGNFSIVFGMCIYFAEGPWFEACSFPFLKAHWSTR